jgi:6,7-dimethyl-8-ribityllumazine synthase
LTCLEGHGIPRSTVCLVRVPGAWELPQAAAALARRTGPQRLSGLVALGAVVRGETEHFTVLADQASAGLMRVALDSGLALGFGLLTCDTLEQALARAGGDRGNKGFEAAEAAWELSLELAEGVEHGG